MDSNKINLPSNGKIYPVEQVTIKPLKGKHEMILSQTSKKNFNSKMCEVLTDVLNIDAKQLTLGDALYVLMWEYMTCFSNEYNVSFNCGECGLDVDNYPVDISKINSVDLPDTFKQPKSLTLSNGKIVKLRLLTLGDSIELENYTAKGKNGLLYKYALSIENENTHLENMMMLEELEINDLNAIKAFQEVNAHGPDLLTNTTCPHCGWEEQIGIPFLLTDILYVNEQHRKRVT